MIMIKDYNLTVGAIVKHISYEPKYRVESVDGAYKSVFGYIPVVTIVPIDFKCNYGSISIAKNEFLANYSFVNEIEEQPNRKRKR